MSQNDLDRPKRRDVVRDLEWWEEWPVCLLIALLLLLASLAADARDGRNASEVRKFRLAHPCPVTGEVRGRCPGFEVDHIQARRCGGKDKAGNMQWLAVEHKRKTAREARICKGKWR